MGKKLGCRRHNQIAINILCVAFIVYQVVIGACLLYITQNIAGYGPPMDWDDGTITLPYQPVVGGGMGGGSGESFPSYGDIKLEDPFVVEKPIPILTGPAVEVNRGAVERVVLLEKDSSILVPSHIARNQLENCLPDGLKELSGVFIQAEEQTGINAIVLSSVASLESAYGESELAESHNNLFGWTDSDSPSGFKQFNSKEECILYVAERLKANYLTEGGACFNGWTLTAVNEKYCSSQDWADKVYSIVCQYQAGLI